MSGIYIGESLTFFKPADRNSMNCTMFYRRQENFTRVLPDEPLLKHPVSKISGLLS